MASLAISLVGGAEVVERIQGNIYVDALVQRLEINPKLVLVKDVICASRHVKTTINLAQTGLTVSSFICDHFDRTAHAT